MTGLRGDSEEVYRQIFDLYQKKLHLYCSAIVKSDEDASEIVQETFIRLWLARRDLDVDLSLSGLLHTIARNLALNHLKRVGYDDDSKNELWLYIHETQEQVTFEDELHARESTLLIQKAIDQLPPRRRLIFRLSREKGYTHEVIALELGISKNTVKNQIVTASKEIREYLMRHSEIALSLSIFLLLK